MANFELPAATTTDNTCNLKAKTNTNTLTKLKKQTVYSMNHRYRRRLAKRRPLKNLCISNTTTTTIITTTTNHSHWSWPLLVLLGILIQNFSVANTELVRELDVSEGVPVGHQIGYIGEQLPGVDSGPPYLIVPVPGSGVDTDLQIDHTTGEIRTKVRLDRETRASYSLVAIPLSGENVRVLIRVHDENDNAPTFPTAVMNIEFPENTPRDVKRTLHPARDLDLGRYNTQRYNIVSGNTNNAFRLSSHRERDGVLYLDLQINGFLDRETTPFYSLVIEALDGGSPPLRGQMTVNITIQDVNDNQPIFNQSRYFATVAENATIGTMVLQVYATDADADENGLVEYSINRRQSDKEQMFRIDSKSGWIYVNKALDFETKELHELVVVAKDHGETPLETTAFVSIKVTDVNDNQPTINVIFLSDDATPKISESAEPGEFVARISVHDPDSKTEYANVNVTLNGGDGHFGLTTRDNIIYLVIVNMTLDRELTPNYTLSVVATDNGNPPLHASKTIHLRVTDINDNAPEFERTVYQANVMEISDPGTSVIQVYAYDRDEGNNSAVTYSLLDTPDSHSYWFLIDEYTGLITTKTHIDCETEPVPQLTVLAHDNGHPPLSSSATVLVTIHDVNDNEPIFEQSYYNITVAENEAQGRCILKVSANDPDCGVNAMVNYTMGSMGIKTFAEFEVRSATGEICVNGDLDYEKKQVYEFPVIATDRGGLSTTAMIKIQLTDINDNRPIFYSHHYNVSIRETSSTATSNLPIVTVMAKDPDTGRFGIITYRIVGGNDASLFRIERTTGEIFLNRPNMLSTRTQSLHILNVSASDGGGLRTEEDAFVYVNIIDATQRPPIFEKLRYNFYVKEDVTRGSVVGTIQATSTDAANRNAVHYTIYSGDPEDYFSIDENSGNIRVAHPLDYETKTQVLLNIRATIGHNSNQGYTQVFITIEDVNDNAPEFEANMIRISIPENFDLGKPLYAAYAFDKDSGKNAQVSYVLTMLTTHTLNNVTMSAAAAAAAAAANAAAVTLSGGSSSALSASMKQSITTNLNSSPASTTQTATATTITTAIASTTTNLSQQQQTSAYGNKIVNSAVGGVVGGVAGNAAMAEMLKNLFAIDARSGHLTLSRHLDYETSQRHTLIVTAMDAGQPRLSSNLTIVVEVQDVNDNPPQFERNEYHVKVLESMPVNSQIVQVTAVDLDTGNNARITYRIINNNSNNNNNNNNGGNSQQQQQQANQTLIANNNKNNKNNNKANKNNNNSNNNRNSTEISQIFGIYPNSGWIYLRSPLDRETRDHYELTVQASDNGTPPAQTTTRVMVRVLDANDNDPRFLRSSYEFTIEENMSRGSLVGIIGATDMDLGENAAIRYSLLPANSSFQVNPLTGEITTREPLDREQRAVYDLVAEARDQGTPYRSSRVAVKVHVTDVNDNQPKIVDPQEDVVSVREEQPPGTEVVRIRAVDRDNGQNASITYSILKGRDSDGFGLFSIDANTGVIRTLVVLDHEERSIYRLAVAATDGGNPPKQSIRLLRVEVLNLNDNRPTFTSSSLVFRVPENVAIGHLVGSVDASDRSKQNMIFNEDNLYITYTLTPISKDLIDGAFDIDRHTGSLVVARQLDRELQSEFRLEIRALDTSASNNPQSSAIAVKIEILDENDNPPVWQDDPITITVSELAHEGAVIYNFSASDDDTGLNGQLQYKLLKYSPLMWHNENALKEDETKLFNVDILTGGLTLMGRLDYELVKEYILIVQAFDLAENKSKRLYTSVTAIVKVLDENDNAPQFVIPPPNRETKNRYGLVTKNETPTATVFITDNKRVGDTLMHIVAADSDTGNNGKVSYSLESGNELAYFRLNTNTGFLELAKPLPPIIQNSGDSMASTTALNRNKFELLVKAQDHGVLDRKSSVLKLEILVRGTKSNPPRFMQTTYFANITENISPGSFVVQVSAKSFNGGENANLTYEIPTGVADNHFHVDTQRGIVTTRGQFDRETKASYIVPIYVYDAKRSTTTASSTATTTAATGSSGSGSGSGSSNMNTLMTIARRQQRSSVNEAAAAQNGQFDVAILHVTITDVNDHAPEFRPGSCYPLSVPENSDLAVIHTIVATDLDEAANGEIMYTIIGGNIGNKFSLDIHSGELTARPLDREQQSRYILQIQATDRGVPISYQGHCNITIVVEDQNDNDPHFEQAKYVANVAENVAVGSSVMRIKALDDDQGVNARLLYTLANETQWVFAIDNKSGVISTVGPLDRERQHVYNFMVVATDGGRYDSRSARVPVQIMIDDVNDNKPVFERYPFRAQVPALIQPGQILVQVSASDKDLGLNGEIIYSLKEQDDPSTRGKFRINPNTGVVSASQSLASESGRLLHLEVVARDKGQPPLYADGLIELLVGEFPQGAPTLRFQNDSYRLKVAENSEEGFKLMQVNAIRSDGRRTKLMYSFGTGNDDNAFSIDSLTGEIKVANPEALDYEKYAGGPEEEVQINGKFFGNLNGYRGRSMMYDIVAEEDNATTMGDDSMGRNQRALRRREMDDLPVLLASAIQPHELRLMLVAQSESHAGVAPLYAYAELIVELEDVNDNSPQFTQSQYAATVWEGNNKGTFVVQVSAFDQDSAANSRILYHIVDGNHDNAFVIEPAFSGIVKTNIVLDREIRDMYKLKVIATDEGVPQMTGTATIRVHIVDVNDNQPTFPPHSVINVSEGTELGSVITTISANDVDTYPALTYRFGSDLPDQLAASSSSSSSSTSSSSTSSGSSNVALDFAELDIKSIFAIDRYSGKVVLTHHLDYEERQEYQLEIIASDAAHEARCTLTVRVGDENDNTPAFEQPTYFAMLPDMQLTSTSSLTTDIELLRVNATDLDAEDNNNSKIVFNINPAIKGFTVNELTGAVYVNISRLAGPDGDGLSEDLFVTIEASDKGSPSLKSTAILRVQVQGHNSARAQFLQSHYRAHIKEDAQLGSVVLKLSQEILDANTDFNDANLMFSIVSGNEDGKFEVYQSKAIILVKPLDREQIDLYKLRLVISDPSASPQQLLAQAAENSTSAINVFVSVEDYNDNAPEFSNAIKYEAEVSELAPLRYSIAEIQAKDKDADNTPNSEVVYEIMSGNDEGMFTIDLVKGVLFVNNKLDYDTGSMCYELIIRACDSSLQPLCSLRPFRLSLRDENDNSPSFPVTEYIEIVAENEPVNTSVFRARATDLDRGSYGLLNYTIEHEAAGSDDIAWKLFRVDAQTGIITTNSVFDFEQRSRYDFILRAMDFGGKTSKVKVRIQIDSRDEYAPQFTERTYRFIMPAPSSGYLPLGYVIGQVTATDRDKGPDGRVVYQLSSQHAYFKVNRTTGMVVLKKKLDDNFDDGRDISLVISASSGRQGSLTNMTVVEISLDPLADPGTNLASSGGIAGNTTGGGLADWILGLIIAVMLLICAAAGIFLFIRMRRSKPRNVIKPHLNQEPVGNSNSYVDPSAFDTIPIRSTNMTNTNNNPGTSGNVATAQFAPPKYDEIPPYGNHAGSSNSGAATTSELSGSEQSGSSGRGSAEDDGEDEEIRMINEGPLRAGATAEDGRLSEISVQNTQEYLARLGIVDRDNNPTGAASSTSMAGSNKEAHMHHPLPMVDSLHMFSEDPNNETDITNLIYAKLNDVNGANSDRASSADEAATTAGSIGTAVDHVMGYSNHPVVSAANVGPSMTGSLSSIVHSEEELTGSYNWDYLLDWGPQYQPLAHVFSEIARLKDDNISVNSGNSGASSSNKSKQSLAHSIASVVKPHIPPPLLTNVAPRAINLPVLTGSGVNMRMPPSNAHHGTSTTHLGSGNQYMLPRSPISHDTAGGFSTSSAMSPSFSPSLSPLATRSPSISPLGGVATGHHMVNMPRHQPQPSQRAKNMVIDQVRM